MSYIDILKKLCQLIRYNIVTSTTEAKSGHPSSSLSAVELLTVLFFGGFFKQDIGNFQNPFNDKFILSKGHAAPLLYSIYEAAGAVSREELLTLRKFDSRLQGHPTPLVPFVDVTTGSLGQGLSIGLGMALGLRLKIKELGITLKREPTVWVLMGDSEMAEGQVWEAMEIASYYSVNNLVGIVDVNRLGQSGETDLGWDVETYKKRIETFGWHVLEIKNGHNIEEIKKIFEKANQLNTIHTQRPVMILARTIKGKGVPFMEDKPGWHGKPVPKERLQEALKAIGTYDKKIKGIIAKPPAVDLKLQIKTNFVLEKINRVIGGTEISKQMLQVTSYKLQEKIATREAFGNALADLGNTNKLVIALDAEVGNSTYAEKLKATNPSNFFQMFIDEENMVSVGLGLAKIGYIPYISTFAAFLTRAYDQIRMAQYSVKTSLNQTFGSVNQLKNDELISTDFNRFQLISTLNIIGSHCGCSIGPDGASQMALEDISMMRSIRESTVLYPSDGVSAYKLTHAMATHPGINYLRTTRDKTPALYGPDEEFPIGGLKLHFCHPDACPRMGENRDPVKLASFQALIISAGITLHEALKAQKILEEKQIHTIVVDLYSIKPLDSKTLIELTKNTQHIVVVEDHYEAGGIGEAVLSALNKSEAQNTKYETNSKRFENLNFKNSKIVSNFDILISNFVHLCVRKEPRSGTKEELLRYEEIDAEAIVERIEDRS